MIKCIKGKRMWFLFLFLTAWTGRTYFLYRYFNSVIIKDISSENVMDAEE